MPRSPVTPAALRLLAAAMLLAPVGLVATSCTDALGLDGYTDGFARICEMVNRCYGATYADCDARVAKADSFAHEDFLARLGSGCLDGCRQLFQCLDAPQMCASKRGAACALNEDCCGYSQGSVACQYATCCVPLGADCEEDGDCCPNTGYCVVVDQASSRRTCGGVVCGKTAEPCLNDFQCCSGRCAEDGRCEEIPCSPEGFECATGAECCDLTCVANECRKPTCAQSGEPCKTDTDCCEATPVCNFGAAGADSGICSTDQCNPDNTDCTGSEQCCSKYCHPTYHLCGACAKEGEPCGNAVTCCGGLDKCDPTGFCNP